MMGSFGMQMSGGTVPQAGGSRQTDGLGSTVGGRVGVGSTGSGVGVTISGVGVDEDSVVGEEGVGDESVFDPADADGEAVGVALEDGIGV